MAYWSRLNWFNAIPVGSQAFTCGYCGNQVASEMGYGASGEGGGIEAKIIICHQCTRPTAIFFENNRQMPGVAFGKVVEGIKDKKLAALYEEARTATSAGAYTAAVLCCRKILMHVAVDKGAQEGLRFVEYVDHLAAGGHISPDSKSWVDQIRKKGNEANHEIVLMSSEDAEDLVCFCEMLLKIIYEFPARGKSRSK